MSVILLKEHVDRASEWIGNGRGVVCSTVAETSDAAGRGECAATVCAAAEDYIGICPVGPEAPPRSGVGKNGASFRGHDPRNAIGSVTTNAGVPQVHAGEVFRHAYPAECNEKNERRELKRDRGDAEAHSQGHGGSVLEGVRHEEQV